MSYTQFVATATCSVFDSFNLDSYLEAISQRSVKEQNFIFEEYGEVDGKIDIDFTSYVRQLGDKILIECDTEDCNNNSDVWDWLVDQFIPVMTSQFVEIRSATIYSRSGVDVDVCFYSKDGKSISASELMEKYLLSN